MVIKMAGIEFDPGPDYKGRVYARFYPRTDPAHGPGWYVFGRHGDVVVKLCARPDVKERQHPHYNIRVRRGWKTKREAQEVADIFNGLFMEIRDCCGTAKGSPHRSTCEKHQGRFSLGI